MSHGLEHELQCVENTFKFSVLLYLFWVFFFLHVFASRFTLQVKHLEDENKMLDTKLKILKDHEDYSGKIDGLVRQAENELEEQIENLIRDQEKLQAELLKKKEEMEDTKRKSVPLLTRLFSTGATIWK